ncbi:hypothetical protein SEQ01_03210 [Streptococcus equinus]|uniref:hypothetical protein n=1 Tax=Streptococcus equinus TaxID=1335 RepID=UPI001145040D|nr:hypothetical protein [Streptococcus equinus]GEB10130.1 hypothetical protein SEQ01_03210 [Streptococcus equinus]
MKDSNSNGHRLLIQKLLVSIHYLTLFRDEIVLVEKTPSLLGDSFSLNTVQSELGEILSAVDALSKQEKLIKSTFWYDEPSFRLMNHALDIVGSWVRGIDHVIEICESKSVFQAILGDNRQRVFGVLIDVFTSLRVTNMSIKEESEYPVLIDPLQVVEYKKREVKKAELFAKIDALVPRKSEQVYTESEETKEESIPELLAKELAKREEAVNPEKVLGPTELEEVAPEVSEEVENQEVDEDTAEPAVSEVSEKTESVEENSSQEEVPAEEEKGATDDEVVSQLDLEDSVENEETAQEESSQLSEEKSEQEVSEDEVSEEVPVEIAEQEVDDELIESEELEVSEADNQAEATEPDVDEKVSTDDSEVSDSEEEVQESDYPEITREDAIKQFRSFLFDHKGLVCVLDARDDLKHEIKFYNAFDRFYGAFDNVSDCLILLENILDDIRKRPKEVFDKEGNLISEPTEPINLLVYGGDILMKDSRFETLMSELSPFYHRSDLHVYSYKAYE